MTSFNTNCHELLSCFLFYNICVLNSHADLCLIPPELIPFKPESESELSTFYYLTPGSESKSIPLIQSGNRKSIPPLNDRLTNVPKWPVCPKTLGTRCDFYSYGRFYSYACCQKPHLFIYLTFFRGGSVMNPAIWNQNGIDSGSESPESESFYSS